MRRKARATAGSIAMMACIACGSPETTSKKTVPPATVEKDVHAFARPEEARVTHVGLDLRVDFPAKRLSGRASLKLQRAPDSTRVILDTRGLLIHGVADAGGRP